MSHNKESYFWTSYSDLMTSLFFIMLVLFVLVLVLLHRRMEITEKQKDEIEKKLEEIRKVEESTKDLSESNEYFIYRPEYKKYVLNFSVEYPVGEQNISNIIAEDKAYVLEKLYMAGKEIQEFLVKHNEYKYILIIEGQASKDSYALNYQLSYERALGLMKYWIQDKGLSFGDNCEIQISGSGDGVLDTHSMREANEQNNQRFLIHILPKNIFENEK